MIHLVNPLRSEYGGSELRTVNLFKALSAKTKVTLWSTDKPHPGLSALYPIRTISSSALSFPIGGTVVFVGVYFRPGKWTWLSRPKRSIIIYNTPNPDWLDERVKQLSSAFGFIPEVRYASEALRSTTRMPGRVELSLFDTDVFCPATSLIDRPFTLGRLSRDEDYKHHPADAQLYNRLAGMGFRVRVMGAGPVLRSEVKNTPGVELMPMGMEPAVQFLQSLDCFFYRTDPGWREPSGRVIAEAMSCALPVVCDRRGGYADLIKQGVNGYLFDGDGEAVRILTELSSSRTLQREVGYRARQFVEDRFSIPQRESLVRSYLGMTGL